MSFSGNYAGTLSTLSFPTFRISWKDKPYPTTIPPVFSFPYKAPFSVMDNLQLYDIIMYISRYLNQFSYFEEDNK